MALTGSPHAATARARTHCLVYRLERDGIAGLLETNAEDFVKSYIQKGGE